MPERAGLAAADDVEQHALPQGEVRRDDLLDAEAPDDLLQDDDAAQDDVGPAGVEAGHGQPVGDPGPGGEVVDDGGQLVGGEPAHADLAERLGPPAGPDHLGHVEDRPRAADGDLEAAGVDDHLLHPGEVAPHELAGVVDRLLLDRLLGEEPLGEPDGADLEAAGGQHVAPRPDDELGAAAADVDDEHLLVEDRHRLQHPEVDQPGLLDAGDHLDADVGLGQRRLQEVVPVLGLPHGAGGHGVDLGAEAVGDAAEPAEGGDAPLDGVGRQLLHVARPRAEPDDLLVAGQDVEAVVAGRTGDDEMNAVGADATSAALVAMSPCEGSRVGVTSTRTAVSSGRSAATARSAASTVSRICA